MSRLSILPARETEYDSGRVCRLKDAGDKLAVTHKWSAWCEAEDRRDAGPAA